MSNSTSKYEIHVHFNKYVGNFERPFRAYVTGYDGECDHDAIPGDIREAFGVERDGDWTEAEELYLASIEVLNLANRLTKTEN